MDPCRQAAQCTSDRTQIPLLSAIEKGFHSLVELPLQNGVDPNANGKALEAAVKRGDSGGPQLLIDKQ